MSFCGKYFIVSTIRNEATMENGITEELVSTMNCDLQFYRECSSDILELPSISTKFLPTHKNASIDAFRNGLYEILESSYIFKTRPKVDGRVL